MPQKQILLTLLSDGKFHSGEEIGRLLGISRAGVWKNLKKLSLNGLEIDAVPGRGYKLRAPIELLEPPRILNSVKSWIRPLLGTLEVRFEVDSTNKRLLNDVGTLPRGSVCIAETQTTGRGRRGRPWVSPFGANIYMSLLWSFNDGPARLTGLSLAIAVGCARALRRIGVQEIGLKWPNDVLLGGKKLAGILLEVVGESNGPCHVVVGIGVNIGMPRDTVVGQPWSDVHASVVGASRNELAGFLIDEIISVLLAFEAKGFELFRDEWGALDEFANRPVLLELPNDTVHGTARGIDGNGLLLLETHGNVQRFASGEVSLRRA